MSLPVGYLTNHDSNQSVDLGEVSSIGRSADSTITVPDPRTSRRHALIRRQNEGFWFVDLGSINGSYLNGKRVTTPQLLASGDELQIGPSRFRFECPDASPETDRDSLDADRTLIDVVLKDSILLVSDIEGFTTLSEKLDPDRLAPIIGSWYARTERILDAHGATLDKFIGDCVLAYWPDTSPETRIEALRAAHEMRTACDEVENEHRSTLSEAELEFRSGTALHLGPTAQGAFGAQGFNLLGDAVNLAFRLEGLTRQMGDRVLVSEHLFAEWPEGRAICRSIGPQKLKGREEPVGVFAFEGFPDEREAQT